MGPWDYTLADPDQWTVSEFADRSLTVRWPRNNMNKKSTRDISIVLIMILRYILSLKVLK